MSGSFKHFEWPDNYYIWLCDMIDLETHIDCSDFVSFLYDTEFTWSVPKDNNRAFDGIYLRQDYIYDYPDDEGNWMNDSCSWLEMLVALARRIRIELMPDYNLEIEDWFWKIIHIWGPEFDENLLCKTLCKIEKTGFTVKNFQKTDILSADIWQQVQFWLAKNYDF